MVRNGSKFFKKTEISETQEEPNKLISRGRALTKIFLGGTSLHSRERERTNYQPRFRGGISGGTN